jgi:hypothetical protein
VWLARPVSGGQRRNGALVATSRELVPLQRRATFDSLVLLVVRAICLERNERIFRGSSCAPGQLVGRMERVVSKIGVVCGCFLCRYCIESRLRLLARVTAWAPMY